MGFSIKGGFKNFDKFKGGLERATSWFEGFESGSFSSEWTINSSSFQIRTSPVYKGNYSAGIEGSDDSNWAVVNPSIIKGGSRLKIFEFHYYETTNSTGGGIQLYDSSDNFVIGFASDNAEWVVDDEDGLYQFYNGDGYDRWVKVSVTFDWNNSTYDLHWEDLQSGTTKNLSNRNLKQGTNIEKLVLKGFHTYGSANGWGDNQTSYMWFDNLYLEK